MGNVYRIKTREELILALQEAAHIEQGLLLQYLYAALSMKQSEDEGLQWDELELVNGWKEDLLRVARDEMGHLGTVLNALSSIGGFPSLQRPPFPQPPGKWFPVAFALTGFSSKTIRRFVRFESPKPSAVAAALIEPPQLPRYEFVGELYRSIRNGFEEVGSTNPALFIGRPEAQDPASWRLNFSPQPIRTVDEAKAAIDALVLQGEGTPGGVDPLAHYATFLRIATELEEATLRNPALVPARPVVDNPVLRPLPVATEEATVIAEDVVGFSVAALHASLYILLLQALQVYYDPVPQEATIRVALQSICSQLMMSAIRPIGEVLTTLPATTDPSGPTCGPSFELFGDITLSTDPKSRWTLMHERLVLAIDNMRRLDALGLPELQRIGSLLTSMSGIEQKFNAIKDKMNA